MAKSADAFRTISEVADWLGIPAHVLRFWESKFSQVKPVKRAGGRRYYRPADMQLLGGIRKLLHDDGMTIKGVQKILREQGVKEVAQLSPPLDAEVAEAQEISGIALDVTEEQTAPEGKVISFERDRKQDTAPGSPPDEAPAAEPAADDAEPPAAATEEAPTDDAQADVVPNAPDPVMTPDPPQAQADSAPPPSEPEERDAPGPDHSPPAEAEPPAPPEITAPSDTATGMPDFLKQSFQERGADVEETAPDRPDATETPVADQPASDVPSESDEDTPTEAVEATPETAPTSDTDPVEAPAPETALETGPEAEAEAEVPDTPAPPRATPVTTPPDPADDDMPGTPSALDALAGMSRITASQSDDLRALAERLRAARP